MTRKLLSLLLILCISLPITAQVVNPPNNLVACDDVSNDGVAQFDLTVLDAQVLGGQNPADFTVTYHINQTNATNGTSALSMPYTNVANPQLIYIRLTENSSGNFDIGFVTISVASAPTPASPTPLIACDLDGDGFAEFDLESKQIEILNGGDWLLTYHETQIDAETGVNSAPVFYNNVVPNIQTIFVRAEGFEGCFTIVELDLIADNGPEFNAPFDYVICETDGNGTEAIVLIDMVNLIFDFTNPNFSLNLYQTFEDAQNLSNSIFGTYNNTSNPQTIYFTIEDTTTGCIIIDSFEIEIIGCNEDADADTVANSNEDVNGNGNFADDDTDEDGTPNYLDDDDDGDGVLTEDEDYNDNGDPTDDDTNMNDIPDYLDADVALGLNDLSINSFKLYPNPVKDVLNIEFTNASQPINYAIYNLEGQRIFSDALVTGSIQQIDISSLTSGLYFVTIMSGQLETTRKFIVE